MVLRNKRNKHYLLVPDNEIMPRPHLIPHNKSISSAKITPFKCSSPVWQKERADVRHGWSGGPELGQSHDVLEGDVCLRADVGHARVWRHPVVAVRRHGGRASGRCPPQDLDHDWLPPHGLHHRLLMLHFGEVACVHLMREDVTWSTCGTPGMQSLSCPDRHKWQLVNFKRGGRKWRVTDPVSSQWPFFKRPIHPRTTGSHTRALFRNNPFHIYTWEAHCL